MTLDEARRRVEQLRQELEEHEYRYYVLSAPTISDRDFDLLMKELESLEEAHPELITPYSPTQRVGSEFIGGVATGTAVAHSVPMLSLANTYSIGEVEDFYRRLTETVGDAPELVAELKFDGVSISVIYEEGLLHQALTRGDGQYGEDVTQAIRAIRAIPLRLKGDNLPDRVEVRGEILLPWREFQRLNAAREEAGEPPFANPRNAVSGTIKTKENIAAVVSHRRPTARFYYLLSDDEDWLPVRHSDRLDRMREMGLPVSTQSALCNSVEEADKYLDYWDLHRHELEVATDGVVLKVDDYSLHERIGMTAKSPKWAIAYKYDAEKAITRLLEVRYQTGRSGIVTPVAQLEPVELSGTTVSRATLNNEDFIRNLDLHERDLVSVEKGGEIIPKITLVRKDLRDDRVGGPVTMPQNCPSCGSALVRHEGEAGLFCPNRLDCPAQVEGRIEHFCSRKAMDIFIGPSSIHAVTTILGLRSVDQLYTLTERDLLRLPLFKEAKAENLLKSIDESKEKPFERVLFALGIPLVGSKVAETLATYAKSIDRLLEASEEELQSIPEVGPMIARSVRDFAEEPRSMELVANLKAAGLHFEVAEEEPSGPTSETFAGQTIVISGVFHTISRDELKELLARHGARVGSSISGKTSLLIHGENMGPAKLAKAEQLGIKMMTEEQFFDTYRDLR
ncbi:NAD-dependent DNA ligase LigA [uncultured Porphyromonas sp.]|uniref:NAD-dependent DNA ligase LigA n=1 Tax=uncultured Porphyromonas sp. TaxID=159274 RepID=UPI0025962F9B|nr:NAD-dependent DNA ligase LigA [uncultured Porphyromonas sp.]